MKRLFWRHSSEEKLLIYPRQVLYKGPIIIMIHFQILPGKDIAAMTTQYRSQEFIRSISPFELTLKKGYFFVWDSDFTNIWLTSSKIFLHSYLKWPVKTWTCRQEPRSIQNSCKGFLSINKYYCLWCSIPDK